MPSYLQDISIEWLIATDSNLTSMEPIELDIPGFFGVHLCTYVYGERE
jgi:hypothetical protein